MEQSLTEDSDELFNIVSGLDLDDLITYAMFEEVGYNPNDYDEARDTGFQPAIEHLIQMRLKHADPAGVRLRDAFNEFGRALELSKRIQFNMTMKLLMPQMDDLGNLVAQDERDRKADEIIGRWRLSMLVERNPTYYHFAWDLLRGLFSRYDNQLVEICGFNIADLEAFAKAFESAMEDNRADVLATAEALAEEDAESFGVALEALFFEFGCPYKFTVDDLLIRSTLTKETAEAILRCFSLQCGDVEESYQLPSTDGPLRRQPIVHFGDGAFVLPTPSLFTWCIQERLETEINRASSEIPRYSALRAKYEKHRSAFIEQSSLAWLSAALPGARVYRSLTYETIVDGKKCGWELDGLIIFDCHAILLEAKSGGLNTPARQGRASRISERIVSLLKEAHEQVERATHHVLDSDAPAFKTKDGQTITIDKSEINSVIPITVSLEGFGAISSSYNDLVRAGFAAEETVPWAVPYHDLRIITELSDSPAILLGYIRQRLRMSDDEILRSNDEVSWFGWFLRHGLQFTNQSFEQADMVTLTSGTGEIDNYFLAQIGARTVPTAKPALKAPANFLKVLAELNALDTQGYSWIASRFLACSNDGRLEIGDYIETVRKKTLRDGRMHDFSMLYEDGGLSVLSCLSERFSEACAKVVSFAEGKKYQAHRSWWIFIVTVADDPAEYVGYVGYLNYPFVEDARLEEAIRRLPSAIIKIPHPNKRAADSQGLDSWTQTRPGGRG